MERGHERLNNCKTHMEVKDTSDLNIILKSHQVSLLKFIPGAKLS